MIHKACYVKCDNCGDPAGVSTTDAAEARAFAREEGFVRIRVNGRLQDLCVGCRPKDTITSEAIRLDREMRRGES